MGIMRRRYTSPTPSVSPKSGSSCTVLGVSTRPTKESTPTCLLLSIDRTLQRDMDISEESYLLVEAQSTRRKCCCACSGAYCVCLTEARLSKDKSATTMAAHPAAASCFWRCHEHWAYRHAEKDRFDKQTERQVLLHAVVEVLKARRWPASRQSIILSVASLQGHPNSQGSEPLFP
jgi:hypothetical protein